MSSTSRIYSVCVLSRKINETKVYFFASLWGENWKWNVTHNLLSWLGGRGARVDKALKDLDLNTLPQYAVYTFTQPFTSTLIHTLIIHGQTLRRA